MSFKNRLLTGLCIIFLISSGCGKQNKYTFVEQIETSIEVFPITEHEGPTDAEITLFLQSNAQLRDDAVRLFYRIADSFEQKYFVLQEDGSYKSNIPNQVTGHQVSYYIEVITAGGTRKVFPENAPEEAFILTFKGDAPFIIRWIYRFSLLTSLVIFLIAGYMSYLHLYKSDNRFDFIVQLLIWGTGIFFIGVFLLGMIYSYFVWNTFWGIITGNHILIIFLFWSLLLFSVKGSAFQLDDTKNLVSINLFEQITLAGAVLTILIIGLVQVL